MTLAVSFGTLADAIPRKALGLFKMQRPAPRPALARLPAPAILLGNDWFDRWLRWGQAIHHRQR
jgi:hypothetical protein